MYAKLLLQINVYCWIICICGAIWCGWGNNSINKIFSNQIGTMMLGCFREYYVCNIWYCGFRLSSDIIDRRLEISKYIIILWTRVFINDVYYKNIVYWSIRMTMAVYSANSGIRILQQINIRVHTIFRHLDRLLCRCAGTSVPVNHYESHNGLIVQTSKSFWFISVMYDIHIAMESLGNMVAPTRISFGGRGQRNFCLRNLISNCDVGRSVRIV